MAAGAGRVGTWQATKDTSTDVWKTLGVGKPCKSPTMLAEYRAAASAMAAAGDAGGADKHLAQVSLVTTPLVLNPFECLLSYNSVE